jgi:sterol desaturase/sphingolipid hydroxylase (fatty acid hydroxylase superfamily)
MHYDATAGFALFAMAALLVRLRQAVTRRVPALERMRMLNREEDARKLATDKYPPMVRASDRVGRLTTLAFFAGVAPFVVTLAPQPVAVGLRDVGVVLMAYDLAYYLTHRFVFHGPLMREMHAVHHQARSPSYVDAQYVHPLETFVGIALFVGAVVAAALVLGRLHAASVAASFLLFTQLNLLNHTRMQLAEWPGRVLTWISAKHAVHHESMRKGNYATITLLYDKLFGTFE